MNFHLPRYTTHNLMDYHSQILPCSNLHYHTILYLHCALVHFWSIQRIDLHWFFDELLDHLAILPTTRLHSILHTNHFWGFWRKDWTSRIYHLHVFFHLKTDLRRSYHLDISLLRSHSYHYHKTDPSKSFPTYWLIFPSLIFSSGRYVQSISSHRFLLVWEDCYLRVH